MMVTAPYRKSPSSKVTIFFEKNNKALQHQTTQRMSEGFSCYSNAGDFENYPKKYVKMYMPSVHAR